MPFVQHPRKRSFLYLPCMLLWCLGCQTAPTEDTDLRFTYERGAIRRGDTTQKRLALVFTGDQFADGADSIQVVLNKHHVKAAFFLTGNFYRNPEFTSIIRTLRSDGHYMGAHSDRHLLYCDWANRDSLLVTKEIFTADVQDNYKEMLTFDIKASEAKYFLPPFEWYNDTISNWTHAMDLQLVNFSRGTLSTADYTTPDSANYRDTDSIYRSILDFEKKSASGLNGFILLTHMGTDPRRTDKFYSRLTELILTLKALGYEFVRVDDMLDTNR